MKNPILLLVISLMMTTIGHSQEWFTSLEIAKKLAKAQDKMLFVMWEDAIGDYYPVTINDKNGYDIIVNLSDSEQLASKIWDYFIPVLMLDSDYEEISKNIKETRGIKYFNKLVDDSIKIMDINGNILNINTSIEYNYENISEYINLYALNTSFIKKELGNYFNDKNSTSAFLLASKYQDFAILVNHGVRPELLLLANIYFNESKKQLEVSDFKNKLAFLQKIELLKIKEFLILKKPKKARRFLKRMEEEPIDKINQSLYSFLNYTTFTLLKVEEKAELWKSKISLVDLRKAQLIININRRNIGKSN